MGGYNLLRREIVLEGRRKRYELLTDRRKPEPNILIAHRHVEKQRDCLGCGRKFTSEHFGNRMCIDCLAGARRSRASFEE